MGEYLKCWHCGGQLIQGGDHDCEDDSDHLVVSNFSCMDCNSFYLMYLGEANEEEA